MESSTSGPYTLSSTLALATSVTKLVLLTHIVVQLYNSRDFFLYGRSAHAVMLNQRTASSAGRCTVMFYVVPNIRRIITRQVSQRIQAITHSCWCLCRRSMRLYRLSTRSCRLSTRSCRLPVLSDLVLSGTFSTHCTDANRRDTVPKPHHITCLVQCVHSLCC